MDLSTDIANWGWMDYFVPMFVVGIGVALLATGAFTSYFGAGKSQQIGFILLFLGLVTTLVSYIWPSTLLMLSTPYLIQICL